MTVTDCDGCEQPVTTVPGPTVTEGTTTEVEVTYTTLCPTTETVYGPTETYLTTHTVTSTIVTHVPTIIYESVPGEDVTYTETDVAYSTLTSVYPITEVTTLDGEEQTVTYTTTKLIETQLPTVIYETVHGPDSTVTAIDVIHSTITSVYAVTSVTTIDGQELTVTHVKTEVIETDVPTTVVETVSKPGHTVEETDVHYITKESTYAVTQTAVVSGSNVTHTYHTTQTTVEEVPTHITQSEYYPPPPTEAPTGTDGDELPAIPTAAANSMALPPVAALGAVAALLAFF